MSNKRKKQRDIFLLNFTFRVLLDGIKHWPFAVSRLPLKYEIRISSMPPLLKYFKIALLCCLLMSVRILLFTVGKFWVSISKKINDSF